LEARAATLLDDRIGTLASVSSALFEAEERLDVADDTHDDENLPLLELPRTLKLTFLGELSLVFTPLRLLSTFTTSFFASDAVFLAEFPRL
jgi:hypothetical protein